MWLRHGVACDAHLGRKQGVPQKGQSPAAMRAWPPVKERGAGVTPGRARVFRFYM
ncbi:hypothetical protein BGX38DRAFT_1229251 [Terfezia claveryi]|nr:hypothetical protein BGX38DRAFT_1229251 [Terfezia claveryi]